MKSLRAQPAGQSHVVVDRDVPEGDENLEFIRHRLDERRDRVRPIGCAVSPSVLRQRRTALLRTWRRVSSAVDVLTFDLEVLTRRTCAVNRLHALVDQLPDLLVGGSGRSEPLPAPLSITLLAADTDGVVDLHEEMACSDLDDPAVVRALAVRMKIRRHELTAQQRALESQIAGAKETLLRRYAEGVASADDWLA